MTPARPTLETVKAEARLLRAEMKAQGIDIGHGQALEEIARRHGARDWNALRAVLGDSPPEGFVPGGRVRGRYLSHPFEATVVSVERLRPGWYRLELSLDVPVDVVASSRFSNLRKRIRGTVGPRGHSRECTSDGRPHLEIDR